jgi:hypothetical protein
MEGMQTHGFDEGNEFLFFSKLHCTTFVFFGLILRVQARIKFKRPKKHVATMITRRLGEIFLVKCQKQAFSFNKREAKVYCYAFLSACFEETCIKHEQFKKNICFMRAGPVR